MRFRGQAQELPATLQERRRDVRVISMAKAAGRHRPRIFKTSARRVSSRTVPNVFKRCSTWPALLMNKCLSSLLPGRRPAPMSNTLTAPITYVWSNRPRSTIATRSTAIRLPAAIRSASPCWRWEDFQLCWMPLRQSKAQTVLLWSGRQAITPCAITRWVFACSTPWRSAPNILKRVYGAKDFDHGLGRASWQRHSGGVLRRSYGFIYFHAPVSVLSRQRRGQRNRRRRG